MPIARTPVFANNTFEIGLFDAHDVPDRLTDVAWPSSHIVALPYAGVFTKHDSPTRSSVGTPAHAVFIRRDTPYRLGFPGGIGDQSLTLHFGDHVAPDVIGVSSDISPAGLLTAEALLMRSLLYARLRKGDVDRFEIETLGLRLLGHALNAVRSGPLPGRPATYTRRMKSLDRIKQAVAAAPADPWTVETLADIAAMSPFHLAHVFRQTFGVSIYDYVVRERLARALDTVIGGGDLTEAALNAGFSSHSHFTARFRRFFGRTPSDVRRSADAGEMRRIVTAPLVPTSAH